MNWDEDAANREIVDRSDDAIVITDGQGRVLRMNGAAHLLGPQLGPALLEERPSSEIELCDVRGGSRKVSLTTTRLADVRVYVLRDVTEQRSLEREVRELRRLQSLGILVASVVHDMNNLLTAIVCSSALLERETARRGDGPALAAEIRQAAEQAVGLLRRMLTQVGSSQTGSSSSRFSSIWPPMLVTRCMTAASWSCRRASSSWATTKRAPCVAQVLAATLR